MGIISQTLNEYAAGFGIVITREMLDKFELYANLLLEWNHKINLTAITEPDEIVIKHFLDSLLLLRACELPRESLLIDVGTGAGFPAIPLKIARPDIKITLLDSLGKRVKFLAELSESLKQENILIHGRAEQIGHDSDLREKFDFATARGVAGLPTLCEYCLPFVKIGGIFAALKGPDAVPEVESAARAIKTLGGEFIEIRGFDLPDGSKRSIVLVKKISQMPSKYPRTSVKIAKKPI